MISETGIWSQQEANEAHIFSYNVARFIGRYFEPNKTVIDLGCGKGTYLGYLKSIGFVDLLGVEGIELNNFDFDDILILDLALPITINRKGNVICIEVFEHIPNEFETHFVDNILKCLDGKLIISVATEGQEGTGHVNCRNNDYVIDLFEARGLKFNALDTIKIRTVPENFVSYLRNTLMIFER